MTNRLLSLIVFVTLSVVLNGLSTQECHADIFVTQIVDQMIPDADIPGLTSNINISEDDSIESLSISMNGFSHTWVGDLVVTLTGPDGSSVTLMDRTGSQMFHDDSNLAGMNDLDELTSYVFTDTGGDWWDEAIMGGSNYVMRAGEYHASDSMGMNVEINDAFAGKSSAGQWSLNVSDRSGGDVGELFSWSLSIQTTQGSVPEPTGGLIYLASMALLLHRRRRS